MTLTFDEANELIIELKPEAIEAFGCGYFHNICINCINKDKCNRKEPLIKTCNFFSKGT